MREILHVQIGAAGNEIGSKFWEAVCQEHCLGQDGVPDVVLPPNRYTVRSLNRIYDYQNYKNDLLAKMDAFFEEVKTEQYRPRATVIDLDKDMIAKVRNHPYGKLISRENCVCSYTSTTTNGIWAAGYYSEGAELADLALDIIRRQAEYCDCLQGFQIVGSLGGGTGSGVGSLLLDIFREDYPKRIVSTYSVLPFVDPDVCLSIQQINTLMSFLRLIKNTDLAYFFEVEALDQLIFNALGLITPSHADRNFWITAVMAGITSCYRFKSELNSTLSKNYINMVPIQGLHFFIPGFSPISCKNFLTKSIASKVNLRDIVDQLFTWRNSFSTNNLYCGRFLSNACIYRGNIFVDEIHNTVPSNIINMSDPGIPDSFKETSIQMPPYFFKKCMLNISNNTSVQRTFRQISNSFFTLYKNRAFTRYFVAEGMEEMEFQEADYAVNELINKYKEFEVDLNLKSSNSDSVQDYLYDTSDTSYGFSQF